MQGVYYGVFPSSRVDAEGRPTAVWVASRPHNWHPQTSLEQLLEIDLATGESLHGRGCLHLARMSAVIYRSAVRYCARPVQNQVMCEARRCRAAGCQARRALYP